LAQFASLLGGFCRCLARGWLGFRDMKPAARQRWRDSDSKDVRIGTSGWTYPHWRDLFYPTGVGRSSEAQLAFYAEHFSTVEVNGTFYSLVTPAVCDRWRSLVSPRFSFAIKGSRFITHLLRLPSNVEPLANFFAQGILRLGRHLGPILWQLPPQLPFDAERVARFVDLLPTDFDAAERLASRHDARLAGRAATRTTDGSGRIRHVFEVRHRSWLEDAPLALLKLHRIALVVADTAGVHPFSLTQTADFAYARLHGARRLYASRYTDEELALWAKRVRQWHNGGGTPIFVYFDNDNKAYAPGDAERLTALLERRPAAAFSAEPPPEILDRPDRFRSRGV
jgi:uncharacterized protein YecE (DUF72 family)